MNSPTLATSTAHTNGQNISEARTPSIAMTESDDSISYLGVTLQKRNDTISVPNPKGYEDHVITNYDRNIEQQIAIAFDLGQPVLIEGGSNIGKTSVIGRMCAQLGWNRFYVNCGKFNSEVYIGAYRPDPDTDGFRWVDGSLVGAVRNGGVAVLDEYNLNKMKTLGRFHEIIDALLNKQEYITLPENGGERVKVHEDFRVAVFQNSPEGYEDREVLDKSHITRYVYIKHPEDLPDEVWIARTLGAIGRETEESIQVNRTLTPGAFTIEDLSEVSGIDSLLLQYRNVHSSIVEAVDSGRIGSSQGQPIHFAYQRDLQRLLAFMCRYYEGNLESTFHKAFEYYYVNRFETEEDRQTVREIASTISLVLDNDPERIPLNEGTVQTHTPTKLLTSKAPRSASNTGLELYNYLCANGIDQSHAIRALNGDNSEEAMEIRKQALAHGIETQRILKSLIGVTSEAADDMRSSCLARGAKISEVLESYTGAEIVDFPMNRYQLAKKVMTSREDREDAYNAVACSVWGRNDREAKQIRRLLSWITPATMHREWSQWEGDAKVFTTLLFPLAVIGSAINDNKKRKQALLKSYVGVRSERIDSTLRDAILSNNPITAYAALYSLAGRTDPLAWNLRNNAYSDKKYYNNGNVYLEAEVPITASLSMVDSPRASELRGNSSCEDLIGLGGFDCPDIISRREIVLKNPKSEAITMIIHDPISLALKNGVDEEGS